MHPIGRNSLDLASWLDSFILAYSHLVHLGKLLEKNLQKSLTWKKSQCEVAALMSGAFSTTIVNRWRKMQEAFDLDQTQPDPYEEIDHREWCPFRDPLACSD